MPSETIEVMRMTRPEIFRVMKAFRDETQLLVPVDITGWTIKLIVKKRFKDEDDLKFFDLEADLEDPENGVYKLAFTSVHTCLPPGRYRGELRWWAGTASGPPDDAIAIDYLISESVEKYS